MLFFVDTEYKLCFEQARWQSVQFCKLVLILLVRYELVLVTCVKCCNSLKLLKYIIFN